MLYLLVLYAFTTVFCLWGGLIFYSIFHFFKKTSSDISFQQPVFCYLLSGLILVTALGQWIVLFLPLNFYSLLGFVTPLFTILSILLRRPLAAGCKKVLTRTSVPPFFLPCLLIFGLMVLALNAGPTIMDDTDSYHIQMIKWAQEYGTVPGIANLHFRFGYNSSWFLSVALFLPPIKGLNGYLALNGLISCWLCYYLLQKIFSVFSNSTANLRANSFFAAAILLILCLVAWPMIRGNAATANYDFISTCCLIALFMETGTAVWPSSSPASAAKSSSSPGTAARPSSSPGTSAKAPSSPGPEWLVWPFYLSTVKLINSVLLLFCLLWLIRSFNKQTLLTFLATASFILAPFYARNVLLSGYLLYPWYRPDFFSFDWKVSRSLVIEQLNFIKYFNRSNGDLQKVIGLPFPKWLPIWHHNLVPYNKIITDASIGCWLLVLVRWKKLSGFSATYRLCLLTLFVVLVAWLMTAPDPRFVYGALLAGIFVFILTLPSLTAVANSRRLIAIFLVLLSGALLIYTTRKMIAHPEYRNWIKPLPLPVPPTQKIRIDGIELQIPDKILDNWNPRCYDTELPCLYWVNPYLRARGHTIRDGFRVDKDAGEGENKIQ